MDNATPAVTTYTNEPLRALILKWRVTAGSNSQPADNSKETYYHVGRNHGLLNAAIDLEAIIARDPATDADLCEAVAELRRTTKECETLRTERDQYRAQRDAAVLARQTDANFLACSEAASERDTLRADLRRLREALEYYAAPKNYCATGQIAREALASIKETP